MSAAPYNGGPEPEPMLTPAEVAALFRVDPKTVTRWAAAGRIASVRTYRGASSTVVSMRPAIGSNTCPDALSM